MPDLDPPPSSTAPTAGARCRTPVIIDTDPGIDDALAIMLACASPELELIGLCSVGGNTGIARTTDNALSLLHLLGRNDVPVAAGAATPLVRPDTQPDPSTHGDDGLGGVSLPPAPREPDQRSAVELMVDLIDNSPAAVTLIAIGPLTNVAILCAAHPDTYSKLERVVIMGGGGRVLGNVTPAAEFNIWFDPEAAARVFAAPVPITMIGLDVTHKAVTTSQDWAPLRGGGRLSQAALEMVDFYAKFHLENYGSTATAQHDSLAVGAVIDPGLLTFEHRFVDIECAGSLTRGMTVVDFDAILGREPNVAVAVDVDTKAFNSLLVSRLHVLDASLAVKSGSQP